MEYIDAIAVLDLVIVEAGTVHSAKQSWNPKGVLLNSNLSSKVPCWIGTVFMGKFAKVVIAQVPLFWFQACYGFFSYVPSVFHTGT